MAECTWKRIKPYTTHINKSNDVAMELAIREGQWHFILGCEADVWRHWCAAASTYSEDLEKELASNSGEVVCAFPEHEKAAVRLLFDGDSTPLRARVFANISGAGGVRPRQCHVRSCGMDHAVDIDSYDEALMEEIRCLDFQ